MLRRIFIGSLALLGAAHWVIAETAIAVDGQVKAVSRQVHESPKRRAYGQIEPSKKAVIIAPPVTRQVTEIYVREGSSVKAGDPVVAVESHVEQAEWELAMAQVEMQKAKVLAAAQALELKKELLRSEAVSEAEFNRCGRDLELERKQLAVMRKAADLAAAKLESLTLKAPVNGRIYKLDLRVGQQFSADDQGSVLCGSESLSARLFLEGNAQLPLDKQQLLTLFNAASGEAIGQGRIVYQAPYLESAHEHDHTLYQQVVVELEGKQHPMLPIGMTVHTEI